MNKETKNLVGILTIIIISVAAGFFLGDNYGQIKAKAAFYALEIEQLHKDIKGDMGIIQPLKDGDPRKVKK